MTFDEWLAKDHDDTKPCEQLMRDAWDAGRSELSKEQEGADEPPPDHDGETYCDHCGSLTTHTFHTRGHERDSSDDWSRCHTCGWTWSGMTGGYGPPTNYAE